MAHERFWYIVPWVIIARVFRPSLLLACAGLLSIQSYSGKSPCFQFNQLCMITAALCHQAASAGPTAPGLISSPCAPVGYHAPGLAKAEQNPPVVTGKNPGPSWKHKWTACVFHPLTSHCSCNSNRGMNFPVWWNTKWAGKIRSHEVTNMLPLDKQTAWWLHLYPPPFLSRVFRPRPAAERATGKWDRLGYSKASSILSKPVPIIARISTSFSSFSASVLCAGSSTSSSLELCA